METEFILFWSAVTLYGLGTLSDVSALALRRERLIYPGTVFAALGFVMNASAIAVRWVKVGTPPFLDTSESVAGAVCVGMLIYLVAQFVNGRIRSGGILVLPVSFLLLGWAGSMMPVAEAAEALPPKMQSYWLWVHIVSAALGFGSVLVAAAAGLLYLLKQKYTGAFYDRLAEPASLDDLSYRFVSAGFVMLGVMIIAGAFWSNLVHGSYWGWDPVEVWSLISWLIYGIYLHLRITLGWRGSRLAWYALLALPVMIISLWGIPFVAETFHTGFRVDH